jgi:hypothetical protein
MNTKRDLKKHKAVTNLYSVTDWEYHKGKVTWDDLFDEKGKFFLTIGTMEMAKEDGFLPDYIGKKKEPFPKRIFIQEKDKTWTIYENVKYFTPERVQELLNDLGKLAKKIFIFKYKIVPEWWKRRLAKMEKEIKGEKLIPLKKLRP